MKRLKLTTSIFILLLILFFSTWHVTFPPDSSSFPNSVVYIVAACSVVLQILLGGARGIPPYTFLIGCTVAYLAGKLIFAGGLAILQGSALAVTVFELIALLAVTWLAGSFARSLGSIEDLMEQLVVNKDGSKIKTVGQAQQSIEQEINRSRRYNHSFSVIVLEPEETSYEHALQQVVLDLQKTIADKAFFNSMGNVLDDFIRDPDFLVGQEKENRFVIVCPETTAEPVKNIAARLQSMVGKKLGVKLQSGTATFPQESLTLDELMLKAESALNAQLSGPQQKQATQPVKV